MSIKFSCVRCGHRLKAHPEQAGKTCKCSRCGHAQTVPTPPVTAPEPTPSAPSKGKKRIRLALVATIVAGVLAGFVVLALVFYSPFNEADRNLDNLGANAPEVRAQALLALAEAEPQDAHRARVTATLERYLFEGDVRGTLDPNRLLRAYLRWANADNVPAMIRMVDNPVLPAWTPEKTGLVMAALGKLGDVRAAGALAQKLPDSKLHDQAVDALKVLGPGAQGVVLDYLFDPDPATRQRAGELLAGYATDPALVIRAAQRRLTSNDPADRKAGAEWFAENPPFDEAAKVAVAEPLAGLLGDLSPTLNGLALRGLKSWATRDCLPALVAFAHRQVKAGDPKAAATNSALIDVLAEFPDETAAEAIALQLKDPEERGKADQALLKLGPVAIGPVLQYLDHPDPDVRKKARNLCRGLNVPADRQLEQTLADIGEARKPRARAALQNLAQLRPDGSSRVKVSQALNAPLLDPDPGIRALALDAVRVWATKDNAPSLMKLLGDLRRGQTPAERRTAESIGEALIAIGPEVEDTVIPLLKSPDGLVRWVACGILGEIGTDKSVQPLEDAGQAFIRLDLPFFEKTKVTVAKITARK
jgi:hypothetical protein